MSNTEEIAQTISGYISIFPECKLDDFGIALYAKALEHIPAIKVKAAMVKLLQTSVYFPKPAEIIAEVDKLENYVKTVSGEQQTITPAEAWEMAIKAVKDVGIYGPWDFLPEDVLRAVQQFGKQELCLLEMDAVNTARAQFMKIYQGIIDKKMEAAKNERAFKAIGNKKVIQLINNIAEKKQLSM